MGVGVKITISGEPGCGKTTVAKLVAQKIGFPYTSTGAIQRQIAESKGLTTLDLNTLSETDKSIDIEIDSATLQLAKSDSGFVVDSRLAWRFLPRSLKIFIVCPTSVAASRVIRDQRTGEGYSSIQEAALLLQARYKLERERFSIRYGADLANLRNFDLVFDSTLLTADEIASRIVQRLENPQTDSSLPTVYISPTQLLPTVSLRELPYDVLSKFRLKYTPEMWVANLLPPLTVIRLGEYWFAVGAHEPLAISIDYQSPCVGCELVGIGDETFGHRLTCRQRVLDSYSASLAYDWCEAFGFEFPFNVDAVLEDINPGVRELK